MAAYQRAMEHERAGRLPAMAQYLQQAIAHTADRESELLQNAVLKLANYHAEANAHEPARALLAMLIAEQGPELAALCRANSRQDPGYSLVTMLRLCSVLNMHAECMVLLERVLPRTPVARHRLPELAHVLRSTGAWQSLAQVEAMLLAMYRSSDAALLHEPCFAHIGWCDDEVVNGAQARRAAQSVSALAGPPLPPVPFKAQRPRRLKIGYFTATLYGHAFMQCAREVFAAHDTSRYEVHWLSTGQRDDSYWVTDALATASAVHDLARMADAEAAQYIRDLDLDVLIDTMGWTQGNRQAVLARRPAPVQATWLGYAGPVGGDWMDYCLTDRHALPDSARACFAEQPAYFSQSYFPADGHPRVSDAPSSRSDWQLPADALVLCAFHQAYKIDASIWSGWMKALARQPQAVLWLLDAGPVFRRHAQQTAANAGIDPARLVWAARTTKERHLERLRHADLALDTRTFGAHTTTTDALTMGVPVLALSGSHWASRVAPNLVRLAGLPQLVCESPGSYEAQLLGLVQDRPALARFRLAIARRDSLPVFDSVRMCRELEALMDQMWNARRQGLVGPVQLP